MSAGVRGLGVDDIPVIETERLRLRAHRLEDLAPCSAMWSDPAVTRYISGRPSSEQETWFRLLRYAGHWSLMGFGYWVIEEKESRVFVGELGFADFKRAMDPAFAGLPELGWALAPAAHGRGLATEAARAAVAWGDAHLARERVLCLIDAENVASLRIAAKIGFGESLRTASNGRSTIVCTRTTRSGATGADMDRSR